MLQRDYVLRLIEQFARALAKVVGLRKGGELEAARAELAELAQAFLGVEATLFLSLSEEQVLSLFTVDGVPDSARLMVARDLLMEQAAIEVQLGRMERGRVYLERALNLSLEVLTLDPRLRTPDYIGESTRLLESLGDGLAVPTLIRLIKYNEAMGAYADAEDVIFDLVEAGVEGARDAGIQFCERLLALPDAQLQAGDLPRHEVEEGLAQLLNWRNSSSSRDS